MPATFEPIATTTLGGSATITFNSIPNTYTDLRIVLVWTAGNTTISRVRFNSDTGSNYSATYLDGSGSAAGSNRQTNLTYIDAGWNAVGVSQPVFTTYDIFSYAGNTNKTVLATNSGDQNGSGTLERIVGLWRSTSAITSINIATVTGGSFNSGTTATLYGILKA